LIKDFTSTISVVHIGGDAGGTSDVRHRIVQDINVKGAVSDVSRSVSGAPDGGVFSDGSKGSRKETRDELDDDWAARIGGFDGRIVDNISAFVLEGTDEERTGTSGDGGRNSVDDGDGETASGCASCSVSDDECVDCVSDGEVGSRGKSCGLNGRRNGTVIISSDLSVSGCVSASDSVVCGACGTRNGGILVVKHGENINAAGAVQCEIKCGESDSVASDSIRRDSVVGDWTRVIA